MANTYTIISSNTLSSTATSVTFSSIPATYTDLVLKYSGRGNISGWSASIDLTVNGISTSVYSFTELFSTGTTVFTGRGSAVAYIRNRAGENETTSTANVFSNSEIYIPNYLSTANKQISLSGVVEINDATLGLITSMAALTGQSTAISSITLAPNGSNFITGSSFYLYGIKNS